MEKSFREKKSLSELPQDRKIYCGLEQENFHLQIIGADQNTQKKFLHFLKELSSQGINLSFQDKALLWTLVQMQFRPDLSAPTARIQILNLNDKNTQYWDVFSTKTEKVAMPVFKLAELWLMKSGRPGRLIQLIEILEQHFRVTIPVSLELAQFLLSHKEDLKQSELLRPYYFRGDDILTLNESLPKPPWRKLYRQFQTEANKIPYVVNQDFLIYKKTPKLETACNYDFSLYDNSLFLIDREMFPGHFFGLIEGKQVFMALTTQKTKISSLGGTSQFLGTSQTRGAAVCGMKDETTGNQLWFFSHNSRDPGQHLHQFLKRNVNPTDSFFDLQEHYGEMRYIFLLDPVRLIVESQRGNTSEIEELLKLNTPIYHANSLGNIWGLATKGQKPAFLNDPRWTGELWCQ
jgi:hypothetical protein